MNKVEFNELLSSVQEMNAILKGDKVASRTTQFAEPEIIAIRKKAGLTQSQFAALIGVSQRTLENWEQGRRRPTGPANVLLRIFDADPVQTVKILHQ
jgi:putative transcriptional regulator